MKILIKICEIIKAAYLYIKNKARKEPKLSIAGTGMTIFFVVCAIKKREFYFDLGALIILALIIIFCLSFHTKQVAIKKMK